MLRIVQFRTHPAHGSNIGWRQCIFTVLSLTHIRLNKLPHTIYWKSRISILGMSGYVIWIFLEKKWLNYLQKWGPWSDAAFCSVCFRSALFAGYPFGDLRAKMGLIGSRLLSTSDGLDRKVGLASNNCSAKTISHLNNNSSHSNRVLKLVLNVSSSALLTGNCQTVQTGKQCRPRSDATECGVWSGSPQFANTVNHCSLGISTLYSLAYLKSKMDSSNI